MSLIDPVKMVAALDGYELECLQQAVECNDTDKWFDGKDDLQTAIQEKMREETNK